MANKGFKGYRMMLFRALKKPNGAVVVTDPEYLAHTTKVIANESDYYYSVGQGWCEEPQDALDLYEADEAKIGNAAAERAASDLKLSERAQKEAADYEKTVPGHVPVIPEVVKKPRGKKVI